MGLSLEDADTLRMLAASSGARRIVEVLTASAPQANASSVALSEALRQTGGTLTTIVPASELAHAIRAQLQEAGFLEPTQFLTGDPLKRLAGLRGPVDLLYLAGEIDYVKALHAAMPSLRPGSLVVARRARHEEAFLETVIENPAFETTLLEHGSGMSVSLLKS